MSRTRLYGVSGRVVDLGPDRENLVPLAEDVAIERAVMVAEALFAMAAIRSLHDDAATGRKASVQCVAARVQQCSAAEGQQAAHLLPGQILVNGRLVWDLAITSDPELTSDVRSIQLRLVECFAKTNVLPALFNRADSEAEGTGVGTPHERLKPLFGAVVEDMWRSLETSPDARLVVDRKTVLAALGTWFSQISKVYLDAAARKADRGRLDEARVLVTYGDSFKVASPARFVESNLRWLRERYSFSS